jgi:hypothetical protein
MTENDPLACDLRRVARPAFPLPSCAPLPDGLGTHRPPARRLNPTGPPTSLTDRSAATDPLRAQAEVLRKAGPPRLELAEQRQARAGLQHAA